MGRVDGKVALITGAARGQGRAHAIRLAEEGADIIAVDICSQIATVPYSMATAADMAETAAEVESLGRRVVAVEADVRDSAALTVAVERGLAEFGRLDIVVANAGISSHGSVIELTEEAWDDVIAVNLSGVWRTCKATVPAILRAGNGGSIILTSSVGGLRGYANVGHYIASKHGVVGLMRALALELAPHMIRVNTIHPTCVDTPMLMNEGTMRLFVPAADEPTRKEFERVAQSMNALPVPWVDVRDVANGVLFLASDEARYVTGITLPVDAGSLLI